MTLARNTFLFGLAVCVLPARLASATYQVQVDTLASPLAERGQMVTMTGNFPAQLQEVPVRLRRLSGAPPEAAGQPLTARRRADGKAIVFQVPWDIPLGRYEILVNLDSRRTVPVLGASGPLSIITRQPIKIRSINKPVEYPQKGTYTFTVTGEGFSPIREDNVLVVDGMPDARLCGTGQKDGCVSGAVSPDGHTLTLSGFPQATYSGAMKVRVRVGEQESDGEASTLILSPVGRRTPGLIAAGALSLLIVTVYAMVSRKRWHSGSRGGQGFLRAALLDEETNTYSLSKLQFYLWTAAALFGYVYLSASRSLVQGVVKLADVPENLPGIILITASTSLLAVGISSAKGPKGAGDAEPSVSDFVTTGGVIAPERLQFLVWTLVGVAAFLWLTLSLEPGDIQTLPAIPNSFLELMGISSAGYVGGKLARKAGPVITDIAFRRGSLVFEIYGSHLSTDAKFRITHKGNDTEIPNSLISNDGRPEVVVPSDEPGFAKVLKVTIPKPRSEWLEKDWLSVPHNFTLVNPDGQKAVAEFKLTDAEADPVPPVSSVTPDAAAPVSAAARS